MFFQNRFVPGLAVNTYLIGDDGTRECAVIDPTRDVDEIIRMAAASNMKIRHILETHVHADFVSGAVELKARLPHEVTIHCSAMGGPDWTPAYADHKVEEGNEIEMGSLRLRALHTPGHTPEHVSWALFDDSRSKEIPWLLFTGDCVFIGDVGRPDLLGEQARVALGEQLYKSVFERLDRFPDFTEVFPGHGAGSLCGKAIGSRNSSTLGFERRFSPAFQKKGQTEWIDDLLDGMPKSPPYFSRMKKINREGPPVLGATLPQLAALSVEAVTQHQAKSLVVDVRPAADFARAHIPGAVNIPLSPTFSTWAGWVLPPATPLILVLPDPEKRAEACTHLIRVGYDDITGFLDGGMEAWQSQGKNVSELPTQTVEDLRETLDQDPASLTVLDVRSTGEWNQGHIDSATHCQLGTVEDPTSKLSDDKPVAIICGSGYRSSIAASLALRSGRKNVINVAGGMGAWNKMGLPTKV